jgi:hypothetical protein
MCSAVLAYSAPALERGPYAAAFTEAAERAILAASDVVFIPPTGSAMEEMAPPLLHRSVCLDLARLTTPGPTTEDPVLSDIEASEAPFIVREWTAALIGAQRYTEVRPLPQVVHP